MGRSTSSCFKIIACGGNSVDKDDLDPAESKSSTDKRGWSFRKRSARHRVLSNNVNSGTAYAGNNESPESTSVDFHVQANPIVSEKKSLPQWTDEPAQLSTPVSSKLSDTPISSENASKNDISLEESVVIVIQTAIRGFLARRAFLKVKNVIKLQAAVRGFLVREQALGTLRCVQAIVKMQALVRARRARLLMEGSAGEEILDDRSQKESQNLKTLEMEDSVTRANKANSSIEKLLTNGFARQLLDSTQKKRPINVKCDPSRPDSAWKWLERWMSVSSSDSAQPQEPEIGLQRHELGDKTETIASEGRTEIPTEVISESADLKSNIKESSVLLEVEENLVTHDSNGFEFPAFCETSSSLSDNKGQSQINNVGVSEAKEASIENDFLPSQIETQLDATSQTLQKSVPDKPAMESEPKRSMKRVASEQLETEGKKFVLGSRKACNPAFIAAHSKFEELTSVATSGRSISSTHTAIESSSDAVSPPVDSVIREKEFSLKENSISHDSRVQLGGSECGTELSISSTLDSPDRFEVGGMELENEAKVAVKESYDSNNTTDIASNQGNLGVEVENISFVSLPSGGRLENVNMGSAESVVAVNSPQPEHQPERSVSDVQIQLDAGKEQPAYRSSPEGSPRSHITVSESHGTPSSQVSVKAKLNRLDKTGSNQSRRSQSVGKSSPPNANQDSGGRSSTEQLHKDLKNGKRRNSFGSARSDHVDQEPRDSSSSNSLPNYMQATESARAKAHANNSPRSSPDVQDKDIYIKKRHSLPGANGKQGSPRIPQSTSQAQQSAKGNERRWQR